MSKSIICLGAGVAQTPIIKAIKAKGYIAIAIDRNPEALGFEFADERIFCSTYDTEQVLTELEKYQAENDFIGLIARVSGPALLTAAAIAGKFNLPGLNKELVTLATEKSKLQIFCRENNFLMPLNVKIDRLEASYNLELNFPLIVKPDFPLVGKKGIKVVDSSFELAESIEQAFHASNNKIVEVEEYIEGIDVSCMFGIKSGQVEIMNLWDELVGVNCDGSINGLGVSVPSVIETYQLKQKVEMISRKFGELFPTVQAILILSFRITPDGKIYIIELHADLGGDLIADVLLPEANSDYCFFDELVNLIHQGELSKQLFFKPTTLIYKDNLIIQTATVQKNLEQVERIFYELRIKPRHKQFLI